MQNLNSLISIKSSFCHTYKMLYLAKDNQQGHIRFYEGLFDQRSMENN